MFNKISLLALAAVAANAGVVRKAIVAPTPVVKPAAPKGNENAQSGIKDSFEGALANRMEWRTY